ncbi:hypothetical protein VNI00_006708 [Paramarasmius palmivorus]|uniref:Cytochrome P450 n=1 Tax=Paramarasmius palmivorus TaxID=297713 RepID=A0AAW0D8M2_9AGAR
MTKDPTFYRPFEFGLHSVLFSTLNPKEHSAIKSLYSSYFSQKGVHRLEHIIQERVDKLVSQLSLNHKTSPVNMNHAFRSVTLDVITLYTLRTSLNATSFPSFRHPAILSMDAAISTVWIFTHLPFLRNAFNLPKWLSALVAPSSKPMAEMQAEVEKLVDKALRDYHHYDSDSDTELNVFYTLLHNAQIDGKLKQSSRVTRDWLIAEGVSLRIAGSDTVGNTCTIGARCLARDEGVRAKLLEELEAAWPNKGDRMSLGRLEKLPYLVRTNHRLKRQN